MKLSLEDVPLRNLSRKLFNKGFVIALLAVMLPVSLVVAEPSIAGSTAVLENTSPTARSSFERFEGRRVIVEISAYNAVAAQTDQTPCIAANGENICLESAGNVAAANFLPFGTRFIVPELGDRVWEVKDRMNRRYRNNIDLLVDTTEEAKQIGRRKMEVIILD